MINIKPIFLLLLFFTSAAGAAPTATKCQYYTKGWLGIKTYSDATLQASRTLGAQDIRRSWTPGTVIETETRTDPVNFGSYEGLTCGKSAQIISRITNGALLPDIRVPGVDNSDGKVHSTNVPGIGVLVKFKLSGGAYDAFFFPTTFDAANMSASLPPQYYGFGVFLIKTGDVEPGPHQVTTTMELSAGGYTFLRGSMTFSVQADSCTVPADAGSKTVNMGHVARDAIRPPGVTGAPLSAFHIPLTQCAIGSALSNMVNIKFDGAAGSASVGPEQGVLGLKNGATAQGIGIQILRENGSTPVPLGVFTPAAPVRPGEMTLDFQARYVQTQPVTLSGSANAAVNFTLSYK